MTVSEYKLKDGSMRFRALVRDKHGKWFPSPSFESRDQALKHEENLLRSKSKGGVALSGEAKKTTLDEYWSVWSVENRSKVGQGWRISQNQTYRDYIAPVLGEYTLFQIGTPDIGKVLTRARSMGRSPQTVKHIYSLLRSMFSDAVEYYEMLEKSPVKAKHHRPEVKPKIRSYLSPEQSWRLLEYCRNDFAGPSVWVETLAGLRCEAMIGLKFDAILWDQNQIQIKRCWKQKTKTMETYSKAGSWEYVPMIPALKSYLLELWDKSQDMGDFVCKGFRGGQMSMNTFSTALRRLCKEAQVPRVTPHGLRHSCTELWIQAGASQEDIRRLLNHSSLSSTKHYIHRTDSRLNELARQVGKPVLRVIQNDVVTDVTSKMLQACNKEADCVPVLGSASASKGL